MKQIRPETGESHAFLKTLIQFFNISNLLYQRGYQRQYLWTSHLKGLAYATATALKMGILFKIL